MAKKVALWIVCPLAALLVYHAWARRWSAYALAFAFGGTLALLSK